MTFSDIQNKKHYQSDGSEVDVGHTHVQTLGATLAYSPADRWMITAGLPYIRSSYSGGNPHPGEIDNGEHHESFTDLRVEVHFQAALEPIAFAPYVAYVYPTTNYVTLGHAAHGRGLREYWLGFYAARSLDEWLPQTYVQMRYAYAFVEKVVGLKHDRSNIDLEVGYFLTPDVSVRVMGLWQDTHGGIELPVPPSHPLFPYHDQLGAESFLQVGLGLGWSLSPRLGVFSLYTTSLEGRNGHKVDRGLNLGFSYSTY